MADDRLDEVEGGLRAVEDADRAGDREALLAATARVLFEVRPLLAEVRRLRVRVAGLESTCRETSDAFDDYPVGSLTDRQERALGGLMNVLVSDEDRRAICEEVDRVLPRDDPGVEY